MPIVMRKSELARRLNVSKARVSQMVMAGMPVRADGKVEFEAAVAWVTSHRDPSHGRAKSVPGASLPGVAGGSEPREEDAGHSLLRAKAALANVNARAALRKERLAAGELIERTVVEDYVSNFSVLVRDHMLSLPDRLVEHLVAALVAGDRDAIYHLVRADCDNLLRRLAKAIADSGSIR
jgi:phage terminase Nu1 subunit (DNA packaging protein)